MDRQVIIALYFEFENELKSYNLEARFTLKSVEHDTSFKTSRPDYFVYVVIISSIVALLCWR